MNRATLLSIVSILVSLAFGWPPDALAIVSAAIAGKAISTAADMRSLDEVKDDTEADAAFAAKFRTQPGDDFKSISVLVFARRVVLVGFAPTPEARGRAEVLARPDERFHRLKDLVVVGHADGSKAADLVLDTKINAALTTTPGVHSVNMRWKVYGGHVFLMGVAQSRREAEWAVAAIQQINGVKKVHAALDIAQS